MTAQDDGPAQRAVRRGAVWTVAHNAVDAVDCAMLLEMLGLDPADGRATDAACVVPAPAPAPAPRSMSRAATPSTPRTSGSPVDAVRQRLLTTLTAARAGDCAT